MREDYTIEFCEMLAERADHRRAARLYYAGGREVEEMLLVVSDYKDSLGIAHALPSVLKPGHAAYLAYAFDFRPEDFGELSAHSEQGFKMRLFHWDGETLMEGTAEAVDMLLNGGIE